MYESICLWLSTYSIEVKKLAVGRVGRRIFCQKMYQSTSLESLPEVELKLLGNGELPKGFWWASGKTNGSLLPHAGGYILNSDKSMRFCCTWVLPNVRNQKGASEFLKKTSQVPAVWSSYVLSTLPHWPSSKWTSEFHTSALNGLVDPQSRINQRCRAGSRHRESLLCGRWWVASGNAPFDPGHDSSDSLGKSSPETSGNPGTLTINNRDFRFRFSQQDQSTEWFVSSCICCFSKSGLCLGGSVFWFNKWALRTLFQNRFQPLRVFNT